MANKRRESWNSDTFYVLGLQNHKTVPTAMKLKDACSLEKKAMTILHSMLKSRDITLQTNIWHMSKLWFFPIVVYGCELDCKEGWAPKNWCFQIVVLDKTRESPLDCKEIKWINPEGNQPWVFTGRTDAEAETPTNTLATWCEELTHWKRPWCWERLKAKGEEGGREWDG